MGVGIVIDPGTVFGRWTVLADAQGVRGRRMFLCRCACGNESAVNGVALRNGRSKQCLACRPRRHGMHDTRTYRSWESMQARCTNPKMIKYLYYGGRGIKVCERWRSFSNFLADMGERPIGRTIDRTNNDGNYEPGNCRWATPKEQSANQRKRK